MMGGLMQIPVLAEAAAVAGGGEAARAAKRGGDACRGHRQGGSGLFGPGAGAGQGGAGDAFSFGCRPKGAAAEPGRSRGPRGGSRCPRLLQRAAASAAFCAMGEESRQ